MARTSASHRLAGRLGGLVLFAFALAVAGVVSLACSAIVPDTALAYDPGNVIGAVHKGANTRYCSTYAELNSALE